MTGPGDTPGPDKLGTDMFQWKQHLGNDSRFWIGLGVTAYAFIADQGFKILAFTTGVESWWMTPRLNDQSGWELFSLPGPLMVIAAGAVACFAALLGWHLVRKGKFTPMGLGLILGGSLGNLCDRIAIGAVRDFVHIPSFGVYNVADFLIAAGCLVWIVQIAVTRERRETLNRVPHESPLRSHAVTRKTNSTVPK